MSYDETLLLHLTFAQFAATSLYSDKSCCYIQDKFNMHSKTLGSHYS